MTGQGSVGLMSKPASKAIAADFYKAAGQRKAAWCRLSRCLTLTVTPSCCTIVPSSVEWT